MTRLRGRRKVPWAGVLPVTGTNAPFAALKPRRGKPGVELTVRLDEGAPAAERGRRVVVGLMPWAARALRDRLTALIEEDEMGEKKNGNGSDADKKDEEEGGTLEDLARRAPRP